MVSKKNMLKVLDKGDLEEIHGATLRVLQETGIKVNSDYALDILASNGYQVDRETKIVRMDESRVMEAVKSCKRNFKWHGRSDKWTVDVVDGRTKFGPGSQCLSYIDPDTNQIRSSMLKDGILACRLLDALDTVSIGFVPMYPHDVPLDAMSVVTWAAGLLNTGKLTYGGSAEEQEFELMLKIVEILTGDREIMRKKAYFPGYIDPISPLGQDDGMVRVLLRYSEYNLPVFVMVMALAGGTAPASLAGLLVQQNAEVLSSIAISKCVTKSPKIIYGSVSCPLDMRSGAAATGSPEFSLIGVGAIQLAKFYGIPSDMGVQSDSKIVDAQTSYEKMQAALMAVLSGADFAELFFGSTEAFSAWSPVQCVIDDQIASNVNRIAQGIEVSDSTLSVDVIAKTGPMGNYLKNIETMKQFRREHLQPKLSDRETRQQWTAGGTKDVNKRAKERMMALLNSHSPEPLETEVRKDIDSLIKTYWKSCSADALEKWKV
jgi:trimethylamine--corrinoid protein Co-methyltransferase